MAEKFGFRAGQTVALFSPNTVWYPVAMFATTRVGMHVVFNLLSMDVTNLVLTFDSIGGMISGASPAYNVEEMTYTLRTADAKILMTAESSLSVAIPAARNAGIPQDRIILLEGQHQGFTSIHDLLSFGQSLGAQRQVAPFKIPTKQTNKDLCGFLSFSSGTTGLPKAVSLEPTFLLQHAHSAHRS